MTNKEIEDMIASIERIVLTEAKAQFEHEPNYSEFVNEFNARFAKFKKMYCVVTYTDAPIDYDSFGTTTAEFLYTETRRGKFRKVLTPKEHAEWQRGRYGSGGYYALDEKKYNELKEADLLS